MTRGGDDKKIVPLYMPDQDHGRGCTGLSIFFRPHATDRIAAKQNNKYQNN
jgi:hypothetical protein